jgi:cephalosporin hydroxylase
MSEQITSMNQYNKDIHDRLMGYAADADLIRVQSDLLHQMNLNKYAYNFTWLGRPIIQIPQDTMTFQEMIWEVKPDLIIETGIAHGGSLIFSASMLALLETFGLVEKPLVLGIDIEIRHHNRTAIEAHPASRWIKLIEGSSVEEKVISIVHETAKNKERVMVFLDSDHTHTHVYKELKAYAPLVSKNSYCVILDTGIEDLDPAAIAAGREWGRGNSPKSALTEFLNSNTEFELDDFYHEKAWVTSAPGGIIKRTSLASH